MKVKPAHLIERALSENGIQGWKESNLQSQKTQYIQDQVERSE